MTPRRIDILGVPLDCVTMPEAVAAAERMVSSLKTHTIVAVNPEKVMRACSDPDLNALLQGADLLIPDGIGVVLAARLLSGERIERVPGSELMPALCEQAAAAARGVFLFGGRPGVAERAADTLRRMYPALRVVGTQHGYVDDPEMPAVIERINRSGAALVFVALGSPRQERWMSEHRSRLAARICQGVGGTFDVLAGHVRRAPAAWRRCGLEWLYRLLADPRRALRQRTLPLFALRVLRARVSG